MVDQDPFAVVLDGGGLTIRVTNVGHELAVQPFTVLGWEVDDIQAEIAGLVERGVGFLPVGTVEPDDAGVWTAPDGSHMAWFRDPVREHAVPLAARSSGHGRLVTGLSRRTGSVVPCRSVAEWRGD